VTDWGEYYNLKTLASVDGPTRDKFLKTNLMVHRPNMADPEFKELVSLQSQLRKNDSSALDKLNGFRSASSIINDSLSAVNIKPNPKPGSDDAEKVAQFRRRVEESVVELQTETGRKATNKEIQSIVDNMIVKGKIPDSGIIWDTRARAFELEPGQRLVVEYDSIPIEERRAAEQALKRKGLPVTSESIRQLYSIKLGRMNATE
jgi:hypothetical protein